ncbi:[4Fe-4S] proteins maturation [Microsporum audouinii]
MPLAAFSTSAVANATVVTLNPQVNEDGEPLLVSISPRAAKRLREITNPAASPSATQKENPYHHLRITVTSGGCHGFQYLMSLEPSSKISEDEDTIFEVQEDTPDAAPGGQAKVVMDSASLELLSGSTVDYTTELIGSQFKIVDNPRASSNCGCGTSFDIKE